MCGINGLILKEGDSQLETKIGLMNQRILHRGPDEDGEYIYDNRIAMGMRRLSIIDLSTGKQPIYSQDKQKVIVFNGEIYNYKILKRKLEADGVVFNTTSDTEVIIKMYEKYGIESFGLLDGMFAFSIHDIELNKIIIARDYFGEKPLYFTSENGNFCWASELKSILKVLENKPQISRESLNLYFRLTYIPAPYTIYDNIYKLKANHYLVYDCSTGSTEVNEIKQRFEEIDLQIDFKKARQLTHDLVKESVASRTIADVPIGTFLSGGVDSSIVSLCVAQESSSKIDTFSIGFDKKEFDESLKARTVAQVIDSNHHEFIIGEKDLLVNIDEILLNFDEPFADSSSLASYLVAHETRKYVKVALTGDGGDEIFGGYNKYYIGKLNSYYSRVVPKGLHNSIKSSLGAILQTKDDKRGMRFKASKLLKSVNYDGDFYYNIVSLGFQENEILKFIKPSFIKSNVFDYYKQQVNHKGSTLTDFRNIDRLLSLEGDMLVKVDRTSMLSSLECRAPFLNKQLWNLTQHLPEKYLMNGWDKKHILKKSFESYFPRDFLNKSKKGFGVPVGDWLRQGLSDELKRYIEPHFLNRQNIFNVDEIRMLVSDHLAGKVDHTFMVWTYYCFQKWYSATYEK
uniref:asparagine synthase (glutamine-hydrolyzing) n=1 Tax=Pedobacter schmidteae TaxID=2201271 RepID=UPI000EADAC26|nr:asparagine synthase (glutamine-hydrolyzing) [Pedobacter schmidteae]